MSFHNLVTYTVKSMPGSRRLMYIYPLVLCILVSAASAADINPRQTKEAAPNDRLDWSVDNYGDVELMEKALSPYWKDETAVMTPSERQLFLAGLIKVEGVQCRDDLNSTLYGILSGQRWAISSECLLKTITNY